MAFNKIVLKGDPRYEEARVSNATLLPGKLAKLHTDGTLRIHALQGGKCEAIFPIEDSLQGKTIADAYAVGALAFYVVAKPGDVIYAFIDAGENIAIGAMLQSGGNGNLEAVTSTNHVVAINEIAINLSGSADVATRSPVRIA